ncbi:hypothetical protein M426DRAFT_77066 [Hypoxylon sp. CI-4A]|nr:hypothetical protein M426DRAFT_77066 [Hypoxylon sp. CI-4A]
MASEIPTKKLTWLITGCSSGFGLTLARLAQENGHRVIATSRNPSRTPELVKEITAKGGEWVKLDQDELDCGQVIDDIEARGIAIDVLINSAGIAQTGPVESFSEQEVRQLMETNFFGPYRLMRAAAPHMRKRRSGIIANLSSGSGLEAINNLGVYGASKSALGGLTMVLHKEMQEFNVRVLLVYLGAFNTPMLSKTNPIAKPLDPDYEGTTTGNIYHAFNESVIKLFGDHMKASRAIYDAVVGEGIGKGREKEPVLPLGADMAKRIVETRERLDHSLEVYGDICNNVGFDN